MQMATPDTNLSPLVSHRSFRMNNDRTGPADSFVKDAQGLFRQPTAPEVSRLTYGWRDLHACIQEEERNDFAHLLNRGSSLE